MARPKKDGTPSARALSDRQKLFLAYLPHAATPEEAAIRAGYPQADIRNSVKDLFKSPHIQAALLHDMSAEGINGRLLSKYLRSGLDAKRYGMTQAGDVVDLGADWQSRNKTMELIAKISGAMPDSRTELTGAGGGAIVIRHSLSLDGD